MTFLINVESRETEERKQLINMNKKKDEVPPKKYNAGYVKILLNKILRYSITNLKTITY